MVAPISQLLLSCTVPGNWSAQGSAPNPSPATSWDSLGRRSGLVFPGSHMVPPAGQCCHCREKVEGGRPGHKGLASWEVGGRETRALGLVIVTMLFEQQAAEPLGLGASCISPAVCFDTRWAPLSLTQGSLCSPDSLHPKSHQCLEKA